ncbi:unnamed protein product [Rotaria sordida]|uniref:Uncharacterized protein n=1 Tax=Rotaria sordida TaxID=392033 RepID=A0A815MHA6_9BILA|nr:unnamed protein product [Rotaria sordida]CAF1416435.1 unnamed protein product [Rotaria sordida]
MTDTTNEQINSLTRDLELMRERYHKLLDAHGQLQTQNSLFEEQILSIVETYSNEKNQLEQNLIDAKQEIINLKDTINELEIEKQRYKDDCNLAVRLLHQHPHEFISTQSDYIQKQLQNKNESTPTTPPTPLSHNILIPTFPPIFVTSLPLLNTTNSSSSTVTQTPSTTTITIDNLRLSETLFKSNTVHRYPSSHFICSNCHQTIKCCDVSVQTSLDDHNTISKIHVISHTASDDEFNGDTTWTSYEPHGTHMTVQEYQMGHARKVSHDTGLPSNSIPQMHRV